MKVTFAADKRRPGSYLARVEVEPKEAWPDIGSAIEVTRKDGSKARVELGDVVWSGPDGEKPGIEVALYLIARSLDEKQRRAPPRRVDVRKAAANDKS